MLVSSLSYSTLSMRASYTKKNATQYYCKNALRTTQIFPTILCARLYNTGNPLEGGDTQIYITGNPLGGANSLEDSTRIGRGRFRGSNGVKESRQMFRK